LKLKNKEEKDEAATAVWGHAVKIKSERQDAEGCKTLKWVT